MILFAHKGRAVKLFFDASRKEQLYTYFSSPISGPELEATLLLSPGTFDSHKPEAQLLC